MNQWLQTTILLLGLIACDNSDDLASRPNSTETTPGTTNASDDDAAIEGVSSSDDIDMISGAALPGDITGSYLSVPDIEVSEDIDPVVLLPPAKTSVKTTPAQAILTFTKPAIIPEDKQLAILYLVEKEDGQTYLGIILAPDFTDHGNTISIHPEYFGNYQLVLAPLSITASKEVLAPDLKIRSKQEQAAANKGTWSQLTANWNADTFEASFVGSLSGVSILKCTANIFDEQDQLLAVRTADSLTVTYTPNAEGTIYATMRCTTSEKVPTELSPKSAGIQVSPPTTPTLNLSEGKLCLGDKHGCSLRPDGTIDCWGANDSYQLTGKDVGSGWDYRYPVPYQLPLIDVQSISCGDSFSCVIMSDNKTYCWGNGSSLRLGYEYTYAESIMNPVS